MNDLETVSPGNNERKSSRNLSSFECHEISRLYKHLVKVMRGTALSPQKQQTATNAYEKLIQRVGYIVSLSVRPVDDNLEVFSLESFASLEELSLNKCPPSTICDLYDFRKKLRKMEIVSSGIPQLSKLLAPIRSKYLRSLQPMILNDSISEIKDVYTWEKLTTLKLVNCGITRLDSSLHYLPALIHLDVSYNEISHIIHLQDCTQLRILNISHNRISVLSNLIWVIPRIERLNISHNMIESLDGLDKLCHLKKIDMTSNKINDFHEMQFLSELKFLTHIYLSGNPISLKPNYRLHVVSQFLNDCSLDGRELPCVDGKILSPKESYTLRSTIFLPPEIAFADGYTSSRKRLGVLIGNITVYGDEIPIHELDMIFDSEGAKYRDLNEDKQSETSSVTSPPRVTSIGKQLLRDNPSSAAELLTRVQSPAKTLGRTHKKSIDMLPCNRRRHFVEIAEDENDLANILTELCRLGVVESAPNSPRKSKQVSVADKSEDMRPTSLLSEISSSIVDGDSIRITSGDHTLLPTSSSEVTTCEEPEQTVPLERASSSEAEPLEPKELFHPSDDVLEYEDESLNDSPPPEVSILSNERKSLEQSQLSDTAVTLDVPSEPVLDTNSSGSPPRRVAQSRWTKNKTQQYLPVDPFLVSRTSESSSVSQSIPGKLGSVDGDAVSLYSSEDPQISAIKSTSSPIKSNEPEDILESSNNSNRNASYEMKIPIPSYTGSEDYVNLSVSDHLQQYFTEQVFGHGRPSGEAPYMRYESLSKDSLNDQSGYVDVPSEPERLVALYREIVIEISDTSKSQSTGQSKANKKTSKKHLQGGEYDSEVVYMPIVFALTDINLYVIIDNFSNLHKFVDAPIPVVRRIHRIECCRSCTLYFGFQRCAIHFHDELSSSSRSSTGALMSPQSLKSSQASSSNTTSMTYMIITKDKSRTHPIITTIPHIANLQRDIHIPSLPKVVIDNKDSQLLDRLLEIIQSLGGGLDTDIILTQYISQIWKQRPGYSVLRTIILTSQRLLLCHEYLNQVDVKLEVIDTTLLKDIFKVRPEDDPTRITIIMKPQGKMSLVKRKWRLQSTSPMIIVKMTDEIRKAMENL